MWPTTSKTTTSTIDHDWARDEHTLLSKMRETHLVPTVDSHAMHVSSDKQQNDDDDGDDEEESQKQQTTTTTTIHIDNIALELRLLASLHVCLVAARCVSLYYLRCVV